LSDKRPRTIVAGNWKMHKTAADTVAYLERFLVRAPALPAEIEIVIAPPFPSLPAAEVMLRGTRVRLGAQTTHVILGHSERRAHCGETDASVNSKVRTALEQGLTPIVAVGETLEQRKAGRTDERVVAQIRAAFAGVRSDELRRVAIAYEPIWAIGTGENCDPAEADRVMAAIRGVLDGLDATPILYGGSMNAGNVASYMAQPNVNGGLVGGASLDPDGFAALVANAALA